MKIQKPSALGVARLLGDPGCLLVVLSLITSKQTKGAPLFSTLEASCVARLLCGCDFGEGRQVCCAGFTPGFAGSPRRKVRAACSVPPFGPRSAKIPLPAQKGHRCHVSPSGCLEQSPFQQREGFIYCSWLFAPDFLCPGPCLQPNASVSPARRLLAFPKISGV